MGSALQLNKIMDGLEDDDADPLALGKDSKKALE